MGLVDFIMGRDFSKPPYDKIVTNKKTEPTMKTN